MSSLYLICDGETCARHDLTLVDFMTGALGGGAHIVQYRHKNISRAEYAENLRRLTEIAGASGVKIIVNDFADLAEEFGLPLHLGQEDMLPQELTVPYGRSTHSLSELAFALSAVPAPDYIALGTMFPSGTKRDVGTNRQLIPDYLNRTELPLVLIGGITLDNAAELPRSERIYYAIIGDAFRFGATREGIEKYARNWTS